MKEVKCKKWTKEELMKPARGRLGGFVDFEAVRAEADRFKEMGCCGTGCKGDFCRMVTRVKLSLLVRRWEEN